ncbi:serine hydrolase [Methanolacinia paynteri]|uniref:serine hydrolase n=1 Tax=Methanolacinia paynteri TaxID=230356 RepID=UPI000A06040E|nr:serine hydrolase [Methanolacinia paynteri]
MLVAAFLLFVVFIPGPAGAGENDLGAVLAQFDAYNDEVFEKSGVPGMAVAVVRDDEVIYLRCFGVKNITTGEPVAPDTVFQLASISKSFTSATIASLVGDGILSWDDRVSDINPDFQLGGDQWISGHVTLRDLLSHRTGLPEYGADELFSLGYNRSEIIEKLQYIRLTGDFRSSYAYSNIGITTAADTAAKKTGTEWEELIKERIFIPAGMANTSARFSDFENASDRVDTYPMVNGTATPGPLLNDDVNSPAGGVSSTVNDMIRYAMLQLNEGSIDGKQVIDAEALRETHKPQNILKSDNTGITAYGLGWEIYAEDGRIRVEHGGDLDTGVSTIVTLWPDENMGLVVLTNGFPDGYSLKKAVSSGWSDLYFKGDIQKDWYSETDAELKAFLQAGILAGSSSEALPSAPEDAGPSRSLSDYTGSYYQDYLGTVTITEDDEDETALLAYVGHLATPLVLSHYDGDIFVDSESGTGVYFTAGSGGTIDCVNFTIFDYGWTDGIFSRV